MATMDVKDANNATVTIEKPLAPGRAAASASRPVALSSEDKSALDGLSVTSGRAAAASSKPAVLSSEDKTALDLIGTNTGNGASSIRPFTTVPLSVTRPSNTTTYTVNAAWANATSGAAAISFTNVVAANGKSGDITGLVVVSSANQTTPLQGELWLFDTAPAVVNDNGAFTLTDSEMLTVVAKIPFILDSPGNPAAGASGNIMQEIDSVNKTFTCAPGSRSLPALVKIVNGYVPVASEVLSFRLKTQQID